MPRPWGHVHPPGVVNIMWGSQTIPGSDKNRSDDGLVSMPLSRLAPGVRLKLPIYDEQNVLLLAGGVVITAALLTRLVQRGLTTIRVHRSEIDRLSRAMATRSSREVRPVAAPLRTVQRNRVGDGLATQYVEPPVESLGLIRCSGDLLSKVPRHGTRPFDQNRVQAVSQNYAGALHEVVGLYDSHRGVKAGELDTLEGISESCISSILEDIDIFVRQGIIPENDKYPPRHGQQTAMLAMAMGANIGIEKKDLIDLGVGCLAHDLGMLFLRERVYAREDTLSSMEFLEITKHPAITFDLMRDVDQMANTARMVAYQIHERCNGEGYPRGRVASQIHPLAKVAAVADSYLAMISPRPHREGIPPYVAMERLLRGTRQGLYDPIAVRALLRTVSLFPIGSYVELSDGRHGRVVRACGDAYATPVVEAWDTSSPLAEAEIVDLSERQELQVVRTLTDSQQPAVTEIAPTQATSQVVEEPDGMLLLAWSK